ncbi:uncharacterized protein J3R85_001246 [Psidium guajava]|nr:uncharacterized protein J3R85_001246 [Psidium guajava]
MDRRPSAICTGQKAKKTNQDEILNCITNIENDVKQILTILQQLSKQSIDSNEGKVIEEGLSNLRDQVSQPTDDKVTLTTPVNMSKDKWDKHFTNIMVKLAQLLGAQDQNSTDLPCYAIVRIPEKFRVLECEKYADISRPKIYLQAYLVRKMILTYQISLAGHILQWYIERRFDSLKTWEKLINAFRQEYEDDNCIVLSCDDLVSIKSEEGESFRAHATRWKILTTQKCSEATEKELMGLFLKTLSSVYENRMLDSTHESFNQLVTTGKRIEAVLGNKQTTKENFSTKKLLTSKDEEPIDAIELTLPGLNKNTVTFPLVNKVTLEEPTLVNLKGEAWSFFNSPCTTRSIKRKALSERLGPFKEE